MTQAPPNSLTCPAGHTFPYEQLTTREGLAVCPVCDGMQWAPTKIARPWSRASLANPLLLFVGALVMLFIEMVSGIGIGVTYQNQNIGGAAWLTAGSSLSLVGVGLLVLGVVRIIMALRSSSWSRATLSVPMLVLAGGAAILALGDVVELGLNIAELNASAPGAAWQMAAQIFDLLFFGGVAGTLTWVGLLARRSDPVES
jgi:hypothetical protein